MAPDPAKPKRWRPRFSLRTLLILVCMGGSGFGLWYRWEPWVEATSSLDMERVNLENFLPQNGMLAQLHMDGSIRVFDLYNQKEIAVLPQGHSKGVKLIGSTEAASPDGKRISMASDDGFVHVYDSHNGDELSIFKGHTSRVNFTTFSPNGDRVVTTSQDTTARVWDPKNGMELMVLKGHAGDVASATFSPDGRRVVTASSDSTARVWDVKSGSELSVLSGHSGPVIIGRFSPNGLRILTLGVDDTARVWDSNSGRELWVFNLSTGWVGPVVFSSDGQQIAMVNSIGNTARVWERRRPEYALGVLALPESWLTLVFGLGLAWSLWRDWKRLKYADTAS